MPPVPSPDPTAPADADPHATARALFGEAVAHLQAGRVDAAESAFRSVLRLLPSHPNSWRNLGLIRHSRGDAVAALRSLRRALTLDPALAEAPGLPLQRLFADAHREAQAARDGVRTDAIARDWLRWCPTDPGAISAAAMAALAAQALDRADSILDTAPDTADTRRNPTLHHARALLALARGRAANATAAARTAVTLAPPYADAWATLGTIALRHREGRGAAAPLNRALHLAPNHPGAALALANLRLSEGRASDAAALILAVPEGLRRAPAHLGDLLAILHHAPDVSPAVIRAERAGALPRTGAWTPDFAAPDAPPLRVVYLGDLNRPQVSALALPAIQAHGRPAARKRIEVHLVHATPATRPPAPAPTLADGPPVHTVSGPSPDAIRQAVRALSPHVLVLLTPTTLPQALEALAERLAPVQAIWGDVFGSVGAAGLDVLLTDAHHVTDPALLSERPVALPHGAYFFQPPEGAPDPGPPPCLTRGHVTFGSFNRLDKINDPLLARWGRLLATVPDARLVIQGRALDREDTRAALHTRLDRAGADLSRIHLEGGRDRVGMMDLFRTVDVALDADPWSGGLTVLELLWMGVPVVTLAGAFPNGRHAVSHLSRVGLADWVADSPDAYVARAVAAAGDRETLAALRATLRDRLATLPLCDPDAYAAQLEDTYAALWADHRDGVPPGSRTGAPPGI
nr:tetratricopeptide repeat protein [Roseospira navarrensis]